MPGEGGQAPDDEAAPSDREQLRATSSDFERLRGRGARVNDSGSNQVIFTEPFLREDASKRGGGPRAASTLASRKEEPPQRPKLPLLCAFAETTSANFHLDRIRDV